MMDHNGLKAVIMFYQDTQTKQIPSADLSTLQSYYTPEEQNLHFNYCKVGSILPNLDIVLLNIIGA